MAGGKTLGLHMACSPKTVQPNGALVTTLTLEQNLGLFGRVIGEGQSTDFMR